MSDLTGPRVPLLSIAEAKKIAASNGISEQMAPLSVFRVLLRHPGLAKELSSTLNALLFDGNKLDARLRELIIMRIGWKTASLYEWTQHWRVARMLEISEDDILAVREWQTSTLLSDLDKAVMKATDETLDGGMISESTWAELVKGLNSSEERIELVVAIGNWTLFSQLLKSLKIPLEEGVDSWPPDGKSPQPDKHQHHKSEIRKHG
ncbi:MAG: carboxymuconolactone decarboxylase family protein [Alphaproteobacteria bacterium]|nr:carboxymuconolactone decarboxylase [Rhodobiaceae bacterium]MBO6544111.1 carboxymuconolactone decarboxylase family protein [Alphaproteobacteria bacterium]MBO6627775.1 carboxymuconolactone decarboxylase family protein [Alphaproteobacteria bacterium]|tara:strand:- start:37 stop:657 length:621 start_codon:yes stop_codon:yes gene_type:complete